MLAITCALVGASWVVVAGVDFIPLKFCGEPSCFFVLYYRRLLPRECGGVFQNKTARKALLAHTENEPNTHTASKMLHLTCKELSLP